MEEIIGRLRAGDEQAFQELFHTFWDAGQRFVQSFLPAGDTAEDIVQEVFYQIWTKRTKFLSEQHFKSYFYKSLRNNTLKYISRLKPSDELALARGLESEDLFIRIVEIEFQREVSRAISRLPAKRREVIVHAMAGMSVEEIAEKLGISVNTVKIHKKKAYVTLREELKDIHTRILLIFM
ncbi:MAG: sigma-70 family RNA polymerase sigma factor [Rikenellaceae bacterium]|nr:sigma-70 family RNA polymerase sigma factor [Rikenellaceae bacterium]